MRAVRKRDKSVRLFDNDLLERFSHAHPAMPLLLWMPLACWLLWRSLVVCHLAGGIVGLLAATGLIAWSFTEYAVHRFVFHHEPASRVGRRVLFVLHGVHHADPDDPTRLLLPLVPAGAGVGVLYGLFRLVLGPAWVEPFFASLLMGYLAYDYTHLAIHRWDLPTRLGRYLRRRHLLHHFVSPHARWGVTSPLWDWVFHTTG